MSGGGYWPVLVSPELRCLSQRLESRYPGVKVLAADFLTLTDGSRQQCVRFSAPLERLRAAGLVTNAMVASEVGPRRRWGAYTSIGDGYGLYPAHPGSISKPGDWDLHLFTGAAPRERDRFNVKDAASELRRFMLPKSRRRRPTG